MRKYSIRPILNKQSDACQAGWQRRIQGANAAPRTRLAQTGLPTNVSSDRLQSSERNQVTARGIAWTQLLTWSKPASVWTETSAPRFRNRSTETSAPS